jgi:thiamine-monophosphate kinase
MSGEGAFIALMRALADGDAARGLTDDVAVLRGAGDLVLTTDSLVEGVHHLPEDPPESIGWKLAAVNLSDLAAKGAQPVGCLVNYALSGDSDWDAAFVRGLAKALKAFDMPVLGGDTVMMSKGAPRSYSLTAIGRAGENVPARGGAKPGDVLYVTGPVGDAGTGLDLLRAGQVTPADLIAAYRTPQPRMEQGLAFASFAHASMDISDGLLIDAARMAQASNVAITLYHVPLSSSFVALNGRSVEARVQAASAGDDYELLFAMPADFLPSVNSGLISIGKISSGLGLSLILDNAPVDLPDRLGWEHGAGPA